MSINTFGRPNIRRIASERGDSSMTWNVLTVVVLILMLCVAAVFLVIFINPGVGINPFPPPTLPPIPTMPPPPTATVTPRFQLQPSWTPTEQSVLPVEATPVVADATEVPATPMPGNFSFVLHAGDPKYIAGHPEAGCNWLGVAGQALDMQGRSVPYLLVQMGGMFEGVTIDTVIQVTGMAPDYGKAGYEFKIGDRPTASNDALWVQLLDAQQLPLSDKIYFDTYTDCDKNLVIINFQQVR